MKKSLLFLASLCCLSLLYTCNSPSEVTQLRYLQISGATMGTTYHITYSDTTDRDLQTGIDELLIQINQELSTYIDSSIISRFNQAETEFSLDGQLYTSIFQATKDHHFRYNYGFAREVYKSTQGAFDPTVMPLVNYWGFGYTGKKPVTQVDSLLVDSLMQQVGFEKIKYDNVGGVNKLIKEAPGIQLDFSALAKGYAVDELGAFLAQRGVKNYLVEIGGEVVCKGKNKEGEWWRIGISTPEEEAGLQEVYSTIDIKNRALATSGNYRNYHKVDSVSYAHTINPNTGFPEKSRLLSVTILAESCILADAYATAFMVMGLDKSIELAKQLDAIEAYFIYSETEGELSVKYTPGIKNYLN